MPATRTKPATQPRLRKPATLDHLKKKKRATDTVPLYTDPAALEAVENARSELQNARKRSAKLDDDDAVKEAKKRLEEAEAALEETVVEIHLQGIGRRDYEALVMEHPATEKQKKEAGEAEIDYDVDSFPPALLAACAVVPELSEEDAIEIFDEWTASECMVLFATCMRLCGQSMVGELGKEFGPTLG